MDSADQPPDIAAAVTRLQALAVLGANDPHSAQVVRECLDRGVSEPVLGTAALVAGAFEVEQDALLDSLVLLIDRQPESVVSNALHAIGYLGARADDTEELLRVDGTSGEPTITMNLVLALQYSLDADPKGRISTALELLQGMLEAPECRIAESALSYRMHATRRLTLGVLRERRRSFRALLAGTESSPPD